MKRHGLLAALCLSACNGPVTREEVADIASDYSDTSGLEARVSDLESEVAALSSKLDGQAAYAKAISDDLTSLQKTFNHNVNLDNKALAARMTERGGCGQEVYYDDYNVPRSRNRKCTVADLPK